MVVCGTFGGRDGGADLAVVTGGTEPLVDGSVPVYGDLEVIGVDGVVLTAGVVTIVFGGFLVVVFVDGAVLVA